MKQMELEWPVNITNSAPINTYQMSHSKVIN